MHSACCFIFRFIAHQFNIVILHVSTTIYIAGARRFREFNIVFLHVSVYSSIRGGLNYNFIVILDISKTIDMVGSMRFIPPCKEVYRN